jgi:ubiquinone biosynthesis UbiH/UbiF/VisC/COQ6 family hydroxylase
VQALRLEAGAAVVDTQEASGPARRWRAPLLVAADSRFSAARRRAGIGASMRDFGRSVIVCRVAHEQDHEGVAQECFHAGHTLALLPLNGRVSSLVVTVPGDRAAAMIEWPDDEFAGWAQGQLGGRLGALALQDRRHLYPLVAVYAQRFVAPRVALVGDAAVGMHPVTAHGYNFGLYGVEGLAQQLVQARRAGRDLGARETLRPYETRHRRETQPVYLGTNAIVGLFTDERAPARLLRSAVIRVAEQLGPLKSVITRRLTSRGSALAA